MKVIQINAVCDKGSTGRICRELNDALIQKGYQGLVLYGNGNSNYQYAKKLTGKPGVKFHGLMARIFGKNAAYSPFTTRKVLRIIKSYQPDVVHLHNLHGNFISLKPLLKYLGKQDIPTVITLHDCWFFTGKCTHYTKAGCKKWLTGCHNCPRLKMDIPSYFLDRTPQMWKEKKDLLQAIPRLAVVAVSDWVLEQAQQSPFFQNARKIVRIHNWIDTGRFAPTDASELRETMQLTEKKVFLAVASVWEKQKGLDTLLWIADKVQEDEQLVIVGRLGKSIKMPPNVICIPRTVSQQELVQYYSMADVFLQPSLEETFGKVTAESLACGTPVVCYDSTANPELIGENCGAVVTAGDAESMLRGARGILEKGKAHYTHSCRAFAEEKFNTEKIFDQYLKLMYDVQNYHKGEENK